MNINKIKLKYLLNKKGISVKQMCNELKLSVNTLNNWLYKGVKTPKHKAILLAEYLEANIEDIFYSNEVSL